MNLQKIIQSKLFRRILWGFALLVFVGVIFEGGVVVGYHKAGFSHEWGDNYYQLFGEHLFGDDNDAGFGGPTISHGVTGRVIFVAPDSFVVSGQDGVEKMIILTDDTTIRYGREDVAQSSLMVGDQVVVIGQPTNKGQIEAQLVRITQKGSREGVPAPVTQIQQATTSQPK